MLLTLLALQCFLYAAFDRWLFRTVRRFKAFLKLMAALQSVHHATCLQAAAPHCPLPSLHCALDALVVPSTCSECCAGVRSRGSLGQGSACAGGGSQAGRGCVELPHQGRLCCTRSQHALQAGSHKEARQPRPQLAQVSAILQNMHACGHAGVMTLLTLCILQASV